MAEQRVVVTGMGVVSPLGNDVDTLWDGLCNGRSGIGKNTWSALERIRQDYHPKNPTYDPASDGLENTIAGEVTFDPLHWMDKHEAHHMDPVVQYAVAAIKQAIAQSGLSLDEIDKDRMGIFMGTGIGGLSTLEYQDRILREKGAHYVSPNLIYMIMPSAIGTTLGRMLGCHRSTTHTAACASSTIAIGEAFRAVRRGDIDVAIAGGAETVITPLCYGGFKKMRAFSPRTDDPGHRSRPFDRDRDGFTLSEGAGAILIVSYAYAMKYGLPIFAEIGGYGRTQDAYHATAPHPKGTYAAQAIRSALTDANIKLDGVTYVNAHGTSTKLNDEVEVRTLIEVFGEYLAARLPVSSSKGALGHTIGAAGAIETIVCIMTGLSGLAHPTANLDNIDPECEGVDHIRGTPRRIPPGAMLKTSFGFGGENAALIILPAP